MADVINLMDRARALAGTGDWLSYRNKEYTANVERWRYAQDHYSGALLQDLNSYLVKKLQGESQKAYLQRQALADYTNHFGAVVDSIAGMLFAVEGDANRRFNKVGVDGRTETPVLGDPADPTTPAGMLYADGYLTKWKLLATELLVNHRAWVLVDPADGDPRVSVLPVAAVPNWRYDGDGLAEVVIEEEVDARQSIRDEPANEKRWIVFDREGWARYRMNAEGEPVTLDAGSYTFIDRYGKRALPIFQVQMPLKRMVGWQLARKANAVFNLESSRDFLLWTANFPKLNLVADDALFDKLVDALNEGSNVLQIDPTKSGQGNHHAYIAPSADSATVATEVIKRKVEEFYISAFRMYGDSAKEKTATESNQDVSQGVGAFLQLLKAGIDDAENEALWRVEQVYYPDKPKLWFTARVERSDNFVPTDVDKAIDTLRKRYFGEAGTVPIGRAAMLSAAKTILGWDGVQADDAELEAAVDARILSEYLSDMQFVEKLPPEVLGQMLAHTMRSAGLPDAGVQEHMKKLAAAALKAMEPPEPKEPQEPGAEKPGGDA